MMAGKKKLAACCAVCTAVVGKAALSMVCEWTHEYVSISTYSRAHMCSCIFFLLLQICGCTCPSVQHVKWSSLQSCVWWRCWGFQWLLYQVYAWSCLGNPTQRRSHHHNNSTPSPNPPHPPTPPILSPFLPIHPLTAMAVLTDGKRGRAKRQGTEKEDGGLVVLVRRLKRDVKTKKPDQEGWQWETYCDVIKAKRARDAEKDRRIRRNERMMVVMSYRLSFARWGNKMNRKVKNQKDALQD